MPESCPIARTNCLAHLAKYLNGDDDILDVGCGTGFYGRALREMVHTGIIHAMEIWPPYITDHLKVYDAVILADCRTWPWYDCYDLILACDVIEHLEWLEAINLLKVWRSSVNWIVATIPLIVIEQGEVYGNIHETHRYHWKAPEVEEHLGMKLIKDCGTCGLYEWRKS